MKFQLAVIKNRARELRALGQKKSAAFRKEQIGSQLRVLTLRSANRSANDEPRHEDRLAGCKTAGQRIWLHSRALQ